MTYFYDRFWFEPSSRLTGVWLWPWAGDESADNLALVSHVRLGAGQDGALESDFLSSHLPWAFGGFHGVDADGDPWLVVIQVAPAHVAGQLVDSGNGWWPMVDSLDRGLHWNREAECLSDQGLDRDDLVGIYADAGVDPALIEDWPITDLLAGLLAECAYVPLADIVTGRVTGCAFPDTDHDCEYDVFRDVFAAWAQGRITIPEVADDAPEDGDDEDSRVPKVAAPRKRVPPPIVRWSWKKKAIKGWSTERLRLQAVEEGWTAKKARKASRTKVVKYLTTPHQRRVAKRIIARPQPSSDMMPAGGRSAVDQEPLRRLVLQTEHTFMSSDFAVVAAWVDDALYIGYCDYGDGDDTTRGFDIDDPAAVLTWMITDRFGGDDDALAAYAHRVGVDVSDAQSLTLLLLADRCQGSSAWSRVEQLVERVGVTTTTRNRGYI